LVEEFKPGTFTETLAVTSLARDFVQLGRATQMIETLQRPGAIRPEDSAKWLQVKEAQQNLRLMERVLAHDGNDMPIVTKLQAERLADRIAGVIEGFRADNAQAVEEGEPQEPDLYPEEVEQLRHSREMMALIGKAEKRLTGQTHMTAVFCGREKPARGDWRLVRTLLEESKKGLQFYLTGQTSFIRQMERVRNDPIEKFAKEPEHLILLTRYLTKIERGIERKIRQLRQH
jgi:hypothetical protein